MACILGRGNTNFSPPPPHPALSLTGEARLWNRLKPQRRPCDLEIPSEPGCANPVDSRMRCVSETGANNNHKAQGKLSLGFCGLSTFQRFGVYFTSTAPS